VLVFLPAVTSLLFFFRLGWQGCLPSGPSRSVAGLVEVFFVGMSFFGNFQRELSQRFVSVKVFGRSLWLWTGVRLQALLGAL
jgi:hypothetical protein